MLDSIKLALRISHNLLDEDIKQTMDVARAELIRSGVYKEVVESNSNELVNFAIKTYCKSVYANDEKSAEGFFKSWQYQVENLRKSTETMKRGDD